MAVIILNDISFRGDRQSLMSVLRVRENSSQERDLMHLLDGAEAVGKPKAACLEADIDEIGENTVVLDGIEFRSKLLSKNLSGAWRVFPFIATCGIELERWSKDYHDFLYQYWADAIKLQALHQALAALSARIDGYALQGQRSMMNPGSLEDWPIEEQGSLFRLFGDTAGTIGVTLSDSFLMNPTKSISGIIYHSDTQFINCRLCSREKCETRRAPYDEHLQRRYEHGGDMCQK